MPQSRGPLPSLTVMPGLPRTRSSTPNAGDTFTRSSVTVVTGWPAGCCRTFGAPGSAGAEVVAGVMSTTGVGTRGAGARDTTRFLGSRCAAARCGLGAITSTCGRTVPPCAGGSAAFLGGSGEGAFPALPWDGSAASGGFSAAGWLRPSASNASDSGRATASDVINLSMVLPNPIECKGATSRASPIGRSDW